MLGEAPNEPRRQYGRKAPVVLGPDAEAAHQPERNFAFRLSRASNMMVGFNHGVDFLARDLNHNAATKLRTECAMKTRLKGLSHRWRLWIPGVRNWIGCTEALPTEETVPILEG
jgi:hypothetical protein